MRLRRGGRNYATDENYAAAVLFAARLADAATFIWNDPMGAVEVAGFAEDDVMQVEVSAGVPVSLDTPLLVVPVVGPVVGQDGVDGSKLLEELNRYAGGVLERAIQAGDFRGKDGDEVWGYGGVLDGESCDGGCGDAGFGPRRVLFLGVDGADELNSRELPDVEWLREAAGRAVRAAERHRLSELSFCVAHLAELAAGNEERWGLTVAEGLVLASWRFSELKAEPEEYDVGSAPQVTAATVVVTDEERWADGVKTGAAFAAGANVARTLQARPGNVATPAHLANEAQRIAEEAGLICQILGPEELAAEKMGALLSVAQGSDQEPRLIVLRHTGGGTDEAPLVLVGKGLTFDAGGISIKPAKGMEEMKYDMSGGAAVLGAMQAIGKLALPVNVTGIVPCSENLLNGSATKPGDVVVSRAGKTIEVINTDAEGRLILADALDYATDMKPAAIVDCATLTGACVIALGHHYSALMGNDSGLMEELRRAGDLAAQPCWQLPLDKVYRKQLDSDFADLKNVGGRAAGSITAACFLTEFVGGIPWAHLDIAGTAYGKTKKPYLRNGPSGNPCQLLLEWVQARARG